MFICFIIKSIYITQSRYKAANALYEQLHVEQKCLQFVVVYLMFVCRGGAYTLHGYRRPIHRVHNKVSQSFLYNFKSSSQISIKFGRSLQQLILNSVC